MKDEGLVEQISRYSVWYDEHTYLWDPCNTSLKDLCALKKLTLLTYGRCKLGRVVAAHCLSVLI